LDSDVRLLIAEDERKLSRVLEKGLCAEKFVCDVAYDGEAALELATSLDYDLMVLDLTLPKLDGLKVLSRLRVAGLRTPVLVLTARGAIEQRVEGFEAGADDYLVKPFSFAELLARIRALLRRPTSITDKLLLDDLEMDLVRRNVKRGGKIIELTPKEYGLLEFLMRNAGRAVTRTMLVEHVWNQQFEGMTNIVDVYINYLRAKIDRGFRSKLINTVHGVGYMLRSANEKAA